MSAQGDRWREAQLVPMKRAGTGSSRFAEAEAAAREAASMEAAARDALRADMAAREEAKAADDQARIQEMEARHRAALGVPVSGKAAQWMPAPPTAHSFGSGSPLAAMLVVAQEQPLGPQPNSLDHAVTRATHWVELSNTRRPDAMWLEAGPMMQRMVPRADWIRYLRTIRAERGLLVHREWFEVARVRDPVGLPAGDYLNVLFMAKFIHATLFETVSLAPGSAGWMPVGYVIRPVHRAT